MANALGSLGEAKEISDGVVPLLFPRLPIQGVANMNLSLYIPEQF